MNPPHLQFGFHRIQRYITSFQPSICLLRQQLLSLTPQIHPTHTYLHNKILFHTIINMPANQLHQHNPFSYDRKLHFHLHLHYPPLIQLSTYLHLHHNMLHHNILHHNQLQQPMEKILMVSQLIDIQVRCSSIIFTLNYVRQICRLTILVQRFGFQQ